MLVFDACVSKFMAYESECWDAESTRKSVIYE